MATCGYVGSPERTGRAQTEGLSPGEADSAKTTSLHARQERGHPRELARLVAAGFIREVLHPEWLANPVLVLKKKKVDWRMCVDYTDLNKHCPKDPFGLPRIDQVVESTAGCYVLSFLDCYSEYHQISLAKEDEEKNSVHHSVRCFLLYLHPVRPQKRWSDLSESHLNMLSQSLGQACGSLCR
jgi:hypothetical protein